MTDREFLFLLAILALAFGWLMLFGYFLTLHKELKQHKEKAELRYGYLSQILLSESDRLDKANDNIEKIEIALEEIRKS